MESSAMPYYLRRNPSVFARPIDLIVVHCTATREDISFTKAMLEASHRRRGFDGCGYHFYITRDGFIHDMRPVYKVGAHATGYNTRSIGVAYEGGLNREGKPCDTRTKYQKHSLQVLVKVLLKEFPGSRVCGHRDLSPDLNGNGKVDPHEWTKMCPCFDVETAL